MKTIDNHWINEYYKWLKDNTIINNLSSGWSEIHTPFLDRHNDGITLYLQSKNNIITITDDAFTFTDLEACGCNIDTPRRKELLLNLIKNLGIQISENKELFVETDIKNFAQKKHCLIQAILSVNDMFMLNKTQVNNIFLDDLEVYLNDNEIRFSPATHLMGKSGLVHKIDFIIPKSKNAPERLIKGVNNPTQVNAKASLFEWQDIRDIRSSDSIFYVFLNDNRKIGQNIIDAYNNYEITPILWSKRENMLDLLIA